MLTTISSQDCNLSDSASSRYSYLLLFDTPFTPVAFWPESGETNLLGAYKSSYGYRYVGILSAPIQSLRFSSFLLPILEILHTS